MKFGLLLKAQKSALERHIPAACFIDYDLLKHTINSGLHETTDYRKWQNDFRLMYTDEIQRVRTFLQDAVNCTARPVPIEALLSFVELNRTGFDKITKKFDKIASYLHMRDKLSATGLTDRTASEPPLDSCDHLRMKNAVLYAREIEPLALRLLVHRQRGARAGRAALAILAIVVTCLGASFAHVSRAELYGLPGVTGVQMPWHASIILGAGWPFALLAWISGHRGIAPGSPSQLLAVVSMCVAGGATFTMASPPPTPASGYSWSWWIFLTIASYTNIRILSEIWPRDLARTSTDAANGHATLIESSFPADFDANDVGHRRLGLLGDLPVGGGPALSSVRMLAPEVGGALQSLPVTDSVPVTEATRRYQAQLRWCALVYVLGCSIRSVWPRIDVERVCFFDSPLSVTLIGRTVATAAEVCFARQIGLVFHRLGSDLAEPQLMQALHSHQDSPTGSSRGSGSSPRRRSFHVKYCLLLRALGTACVPAISLAQCCCWCGVTTTRQIWHGVEESIWAALVACMIPAFAFLGSRCAILVTTLKAVPVTSTQRIGTQPTLTVSSTDRAVKVRGASRAPPAGLAVCLRFARVGLVASVIFVAFMVTVDVPMYVARWRLDEARGQTYLSVWEGLFDSMQCDSVSREWVVWQEDVPWMSAYFTACVWSSLWMAWAAPALELPAARTRKNGHLE